MKPTHSTLDCSRYRYGSRNLRRVIAVLLFVSTVFATSAIDFTVSPNEDGSLDVSLALDWHYDELFFSGISADYLNGSDRQTFEAGYVATFDRTLTLQGDILGVSVDEGNVTLEAAANLKWDRMSIREIGYIDQDGTRFFILNDRVLNLVLPRLRLDGRFAFYPFTLTVGGEYAPWLCVAIDQELTISPGLDATPFSSAQPAHHAYSLNGSLRWENRFFAPRVHVEYDDLRIEYGILTAGGEAVIHHRIEVLTYGVTAELRFIELNGLHPTVSIGNETTRLTDLGITDAVPSSTTRLKYSFGFGQ